MKGFSTKYALTSGMRPVDAEPGDPGSKYYYGPVNGWQQQFILGKTFFVDRDEAVRNAKAQAVRKIATHQKAIAKLEKLAVAERWEK